MITLLLDENKLLFNNEHDIYFKDVYFDVLLSFLIIGFAVIFALLVIRPRLYMKNLPRFHKRFAFDSDLIVFTLYFFFFLRVLGYVDLGNILNYFVRILNFFGIVIPIYVGYDISRKKIVFVHRLWVVLIFIIFFLEIVDGNRGNALTPVAGIILGFYFGIGSRKTQIGFYLIMSISFIPLAYLFSFVGEYRDSFDRFGAATFSTDRIEKFVHLLNSNGLVKDSDHNSKDYFLQRVINNPNIAVVALSPGVIPYRGFESLKNEFANMFTLVGLNEENAQQSIRERRDQSEKDDFGQGTSNRYGYLSNANTSVEFSIMADSYSRGGMSVLFVYVFVTICILGWAEDYSYIYFRGKNLLLGSMLSTYFVVSAFMTLYWTTSLNFLRSSFLMFVFVTLVFSGFQFLLKGRNR